LLAQVEARCSSPGSFHCSGCSPTSLEEVFANRGEYEALGVVGYELLPHLNRFELPFLETVRCYSERVVHDVIALADGAAVLHTSGEDYRCIGQAVRFRKGVMAPIDAAV